MIGVGMGGNRTKKEAKLSNLNEASVSFHVTNLAFDALRCLYLSSSTTVSKEILMVSMRPDVLVVRGKYYPGDRCQSPGKNGELVVRNEYAAGQAYDNSMGLRQMGIDHPFVCLSTYDYMQIGTLQGTSDDSFSEAVRKVEDAEHCMRRTNHRRRRSAVRKRAVSL